MKLLLLILYVLHDLSLEERSVLDICSVNDNTTLYWIYATRDYEITVLKIMALLIKSMCETLVVCTCL